MLMKNAPEHDLAYTTMKMKESQLSDPLGSAENFEAYDDFAPSDCARTFDFALAVNLAPLGSAHNCAPLGSA